MSDEAKPPTTRQHDVRAAIITLGEATCTSPEVIRIELLRAFNVMLDSETVALLESLEHTF